MRAARVRVVCVLFAIRAMPLYAHTLECARARTNTLPHALTHRKSEVNDNATNGNEEDEERQRDRARERGGIEYYALSFYCRKFVNSNNSSSSSSNASVSSQHLCNAESFFCSINGKSRAKTQMHFALCVCSPRLRMYEFLCHQSTSYYFQRAQPAAENVQKRRRRRRRQKMCEIGIESYGRNNNMQSKNSNEIRSCRMRIANNRTTTIRTRKRRRRRKTIKTRNWQRHNRCDTTI